MEGDGRLLDWLVGQLQVVKLMVDTHGLLVGDLDFLLEIGGLGDDAGEVGEAARLE
jgi:hypothetical protein